MIIILIIFIIFLLLFSLSWAFIIFFRFIIKRNPTNQFVIEYGLKNNEFTEDFFNIPKEQYFIDSESKDKLSLWTIKGNINKTIVFSHGHYSSSYGTVKYMKSFIEKGWNIVTFDHRNHGDSEGNFVSFGVLEKNDLKKVCDWAWERYPETKLFGIFGESMGASIALIYSNFDNRINFIIADSPYSDLNKQISFILKNKVNIPKIFHPLIILNTKLFVKLFMGLEFKDVTPIKSIMRNKIPILFCHGSDDDYISCNMSIEMFNKRKNFAYTDIFIQEKGKHGSSIIVNREKYENKLWDFINFIEKNII